MSFRSKRKKEVEVRSGWSGELFEVGDVSVGAQQVTSGGWECVEGRVLGFSHYQGTDPYTTKVPERATGTGVRSTTLCR